MKYSYILLVINVVLTFSSCERGSNSIECYSKTTPIKSLETEYGCVNTKYQLYNSVPLNNYRIIRNQQDFDQLTDDLDCRPQIDFNRYDLVLGKKQLTSGNESISYSYFEDCSGKKLTVTFIQNATMEAPSITYHALIPKLNPNEQVSVETVVQ